MSSELDPSQATAKATLKAFMEDSRTIEQVHYYSCLPKLPEYLPPRCRPTGGIYPHIMGVDPFVANPFINFEKYLDMPKIAYKPVKKYFHTFLHHDTNREITLCIVTTEVGLAASPSEMYNLNVGYSVKLPTCTKKESLGKDISLGRALKTPLEKVSFPYNYVKDRGVLKAVALNWERKLQKSINEYIKGVR